MSRDYKNRIRGRRKRDRLAPWVGVLGGLLIGLFVAFLVYIKLQAETREPVYIQETLPPPVASDSQEDVRDVRKDAPDAIPPPPKPRFDFYTLLPEIEVVVPDEEIEQNRIPPAPAPVEEAEPAAAPAMEKPAPVAASKPPAVVQPATPAAPPAATGTFFLQVGSFSDASKAERFRAELALLGLQTSIQRVTINSKDTYHRVRVGPFGTLGELDSTRQRLKQNGIDSTPIKVRG